MRRTDQGKEKSDLEAFCEVRFGAEVFRTPCVRGSRRPFWNWQFDLRLPQPLQEGSWGSEGDILSLVVLDAHAIGDPKPLGSAKLALRGADLAPNGLQKDLWLPLEVNIILANFGISDSESLIVGFSV